jgi:hypothetical protein
MPGQRTAQLKNPALYEKLRETGAGKEKAARISNASATRGRSSVGRKGGRARSYESWSVGDLKDRAKELGVSGYSTKTKPQLISSLRNR